METPIGYIKWRGDITFRERPFNEVDNLILTLLSYLDYSDAVSYDFNIGLELRHIVDLYKIKERPSFDKMYQPLLEAAAASDRFGSLAVSGYREYFDKERSVQFAAVTFTFPDGSHFISYRGTDISIAGWREDFMMSFCVIGSQKLALEYLEDAFTELGGRFIVGGHSKGGNLALYSAAMCSDIRRITAVYSNDGPGLCEDIIDPEALLPIAPLIHRYSPAFSVVGQLFNSDNEVSIVRSNAKGIAQHDGNTWLCEGEGFIREEKFEHNAEVINDVIDEWIEKQDSSHRISFTNDFFDSMEASGSDSFDRISEQGITGFQKMLSSFIRSRPDSKETFGDLVSALYNSINKTNFLGLFRSYIGIYGIALIILGILCMAKPAIMPLMLGSFVYSCVLVYSLISAKRTLDNVKNNKARRRNFLLFYSALTLFSLIGLIIQPAATLSGNMIIGILLWFNAYFMLRRFLIFRKRSGIRSVMSFSGFLLAFVLGGISFVSQGLYNRMVLTGFYFVCLGISAILRELYAGENRKKLIEKIKTIEKKNILKNRQR